MVNHITKTAWLNNGILSLVYFLLYTPIFVMVVYSFNAAPQGTHWLAWSMKWYHILWADPYLWTAAKHSVMVAGSTALITSFLSALIAYAFCRYQFWGKQHCMSLLLIIMVAPDILIGTGYLMAYHALHWPLGFLSLCLGHISMCLPFAVFINLGHLLNLRPSLFESAQDLGATEFQVFYALALPLLRNSLLASALLSAILSLDDAIISYFVTGPEFQTLPLYLYGAIKTGTTPEVNALSTIMLLMTVALTVTAHHLLSTRKQI